MFIKKAAILREIAAFLFVVMYLLLVTVLVIFGILLLISIVDFKIHMIPDQLNMLLFLAIKNISLMLCFWAWSIRYMRAG